MEVRPGDEGAAGHRAGAGSAAAAVRDYLLEQVSALHWAVADGDVHDARVACRRTRSVLLAHLGLFTAGQRERVVAVARRAKALGRDLSAARDAEVGEDVVRGWAIEQGWPQERLDRAVRLVGPAGATVGAVDRARTGLVALADDVAAVAASPVWGPGGSTAAVPGLDGNRGHEQERLAHRVARARRSAGDPAVDPRWHDVRKAAKRLRYTAEVAHRSGDVAAGDVAASARRLQTALGDLQDLHRVARRLEEVAGTTTAAEDLELVEDLSRQAVTAAAAARSDLDEALHEAVPTVVGGSGGPTTAVPEDPP
jgi:CHAD domain-containing protein